MAKTMALYEAEVADYKRQLFDKLDENVEHILELGIGTGPNLKYYRNLPHLEQVVGEGTPVPDESMDIVVCTLTLCWVSDVPRTLEEGTGVRFWQGVLDPLQQWVADGCHFTQDTLQDIDGA